MRSREEFILCIFKHYFFFLKSACLANSQVVFIGHWLFFGYHQLFILSQWSNHILRAAPFCTIQKNLGNLFLVPQPFCVDWFSSMQNHRIFGSDTLLLTFQSTKEVASLNGFLLWEELTLSQTSIKCANWRILIGVNNTGLFADCHLSNSAQRQRGFFLCASLTQKCITKATKETDWRGVCV